MSRKKFAGITILLFAISVLSSQARAGKKVEKKMDLEAAIAALRNVDPELFKDPEQSKRKRSEINKAEDKIMEAQQVIHKAGKEGAARIKQELKTLKDKNEKDDIFRLFAAFLLCGIEGLDGAKEVAAILDMTELDANFNTAFFVAFGASFYQDPKGIPILIACLRNRKGVVFAPNHFIQICWPENQAFIWGVYGPKGLPALHDALKAATDPMVKASAMAVLGVSQYLPAIETVRAMAGDTDSGIRSAAVLALGHYGDPQDFGSISAALNETDKEMKVWAIRSAILYGDLRMAELIIPLLKHDDMVMRLWAFGAIRSLPTPEGWSAAIQVADEVKRQKGQPPVMCMQSEVFDSELKKCGVTSSEYLKKGKDEQQALIKQIIHAREGQYILKPNDRKLTHDELLKACADWKKRGRIIGGDYEWVEHRHILSAATVADIDALLEVRGVVMRRLSDECLPEIEILEDLTRRLGRSRYRKEVGLTEKAE
ncbi:MAG TPA: HEAT repeat domain-containing protein [Candidatus Brocadiia bacterium]|nr:HEAT repeat domain-containing protein [Candidatus Brocadiia bacterium]